MKIVKSFYFYDSAIIKSNRVIANNNDSKRGNIV